MASIPEQKPTAPKVTPRKIIGSLKKSVQGHLKDYMARQKNATALSNVYRTVMKEVEKPLITLLLKKNKGNQSKTADMLGMNRNTLKKKLVMLKIPHS
jgi:DNA-binding protein Fis